MSEADIRRQVAEEIAYRIRAELVCCNVFHETEHIRNRDDDSSLATQITLHDAVRGHWICYWGEASALLAEDSIPGSEGPGGPA